MKSILLVLIICFLTSVPAFAAPEMSDSEAKKSVQESLSDTSGLGIELKSWDVTASDVDHEGKFNRRDYQWLQAYTKAGIITIQEDQCIQNYKELKINPTIQTATMVQKCAEHWSNMGKNIIGKMIVQKTQKGEELAQKSGFPQQQGELHIRRGVFRVDKIVKNEARRKGVDDYRLVMATFKVQWTSEFKQAAAIMGDSLSEDRKTICLFKFDPFNSK